MRFRVGVVVVASLLAVLGAAGCGGSSSTSAGSSAAESSSTVAAEPSSSTEAAQPTAAATGESAEATSEAAPAVKQGGVIKIGTINVVDSLNPFNYIESQGLVAQTMVYPTLVQYAPGVAEFEGDLAESWELSPDGTTLTFKLRQGNWSDGKPITADDVAWTVNTTLKFKDGPTGTAAAAVNHVTEAKVVDPATVALVYDGPVANALPQLQQLIVLPKHVWEPYAAGDGKKLKTFSPQEQLPIVGAGPYTLEKWEEKGTTIFKAYRDFYGSQSVSDAIALVYFTNEDAMLADLKSGKIDMADEVPITAATKLATEPGLKVVEIPGAETTNITWNSNPKKTRNRELLDPEVKKALSMTIDRERIIDVVFDGHANTVESLVGNIAGKWENKNLGPLVRDVAAANAKLDELGYTRGADGVRIAPATDVEKAHPMEYEVMVPDSLNFNGKREFEVIRDNFAEAGVKLKLLPGGDSTAAYAIETGDNCDAAKGTGYETFDMALWDWVGYLDPDFQLSVVTKGQWCSWSDTGWDNPEYDKKYNEQGTLVDETARKALVDEMQQMIYDAVVYTQLVNMNYVSAHRDDVGGVHPELNGYSKRYYSDIGKLG